MIVGLVAPRRGGADMALLLFLLRIEFVGKGAELALFGMSLVLSPIGWGIEKFCDICIWRVANSPIGS